MLSALSRGQFGGRRFLQARETHLRGLVRFDTRGTKHHDGVADALVLELDKWMQVLGKNPQWAGRRTLQKFRVFVGNFGCVLWPELDVPWGHGGSLRKRRTSIV